MKYLKIICLCLTFVLFLAGCNCSKEVKYTVTFDSDGGTDVSSVTILENETIKKPSDPTKEGYTFDGWYNGDVKFDFKTKITKNLTLKAKWILTKEENNSETKKNDGKTNNNGGNLVDSKKDTENLDDSKNSIESISLSESSLVLDVNESITINATINSSNKTITWTSSDESVAIVSSNGNVTALKNGTTTITATCGSTSAKVVVTVVDYDVEIEKIKDSTIDQVKVLIKSTENKYYSGTIKVTYKAGNMVSYNITKDGKMFVKDTISKVEIVKVNK